MADRVPLLITMDLELAPDHDLVEQREVLDRLRVDLDELGVPLTIFCTANAAERFAPEVRRLRGAGHEIACHGLHHTAEEDYRRMSPARTRSAIGEATRRLAAVSGERPRSFRGPRMTTSATTQEALTDHGYEADFSVCPRRLDIVTCRGGHWAWLVAPRVQYTPSHASPFRRGDRPLLVVPLSALGLPLLSGTVYLFGLRATLRLYSRLHRDACRSAGAPLVYLFHSYEFTRLTARGGQPLHHRLYGRDRQRRYAQHIELLTAMCAAKVRPMTAHSYVTNVGLS